MRPSYLWLLVPVFLIGTGVGGLVEQTKHKPAVPAASEPLVDGVSRLHTRMFVYEQIIHGTVEEIQRLQARVKSLENGAELFDNLYRRVEMLERRDRISRGLPPEAKCAGTVFPPELLPMPRVVDKD